ncbi:TRAP transporter permease [Chloroflexota bacterium]
MQKLQDNRPHLDSANRKPTKVWRVISLVLPAIALLSGIVYIFQINILGGLILSTAYLYLLLALFLPLVFIWIPITKRADKDNIPWYDILLIVISFGAPIYFFFMTGEGLLQWTVTAPLHATIIGGTLWAVIIEAARRAAGSAFALFVLVVSTYPFYAFIMPRLLQSSTFSLTQVINFHAFAEDGLVGIPMRVFGNLILGFMTFAIALQTAGGKKFFAGLSQALTGVTRGGPAKMAVVSSGFFGSFSGSSPANVIATGSVTIPMMTRMGLPPHVAAGIESVASSGGNIMPPIMASAAFIMAEFLNVSYAVIVIAAVIPAFLYYLTLFLEIDAYAARNRLKPIAITTLQPKAWRLLLDNIHLMLGFAILIYVLFGLMRVQASPWIAAAVLLVLAMLRKQTRLDLRDLTKFIEEIGRNLGLLVAILSSVGLVVGSFIITGVAHALPFAISQITGGNLYFALAISAVAAYILGMGVSTTATYIFLAIVIAPVLIGMGVNPIAAHYYLLYCAGHSSITPPVAVACFAAARIAQCDAMKTAFQAVRFGIPLFILPIFFVLNPALLLQGSPMEYLQVLPTIVLGLAFMAGAIEGYMWRIGIINSPIRVLFFTTGLLLAIPTTFTDILGAGLLALIAAGYLLKYVVRRWTMP